MPKPKYDWEALVSEWIAEKRNNKDLTQAEFFRARGIAPSLGSRRIGPRLKAVWQEVREKATQEVIAKTGTDLAGEIERLLRVGKTALATGARNILPKAAEDGSELPPPQQPASFTESLALMKEGLKFINISVQLLSGGEPLKPEKPEETVIEFILPSPDTPLLEGSEPEAEDPPEPGHDEKNTKA